jgi:anti-anti-sigma factor
VSNVARVATPVVAVLRRGPRTVAELGGDLDVAAASPLRERLRGLLRPGTSLLIIDLSAVSWCGVAVLAVLIGIQRWAAARDISVRLAAPGPQVAELLRVTGLERTLVICAAPGDVLAPPMEFPEQSRQGDVLAVLAGQAIAAR